MRMLLAALAALSLSACGESDVMREIRRDEAERAQKAAAVVEMSEQFLAEAAARPGAETLPSGLVYEVTTEGPDQALAKPTAEAVVLVHYEGKLADGTVFDSSFERGAPVDFPLAGVVPGFSEAIRQMRPGDEFLVTMPAALGYGARGQPPSIPPNAALQFRIQLLAFQGPDGRLVQAPRP